MSSRPSSDSWRPWDTLLPDLEVLSPKSPMIWWCFVDWFVVVAASTVVVVAVVVEDDPAAPVVPGALPLEDWCKL